MEKRKRNLQPLSQLKLDQGIPLLMTQKEYRNYVINQFTSQWANLILSSVMNCAKLERRYYFKVFMMDNGEIANATWDSKEGRFIDINFRLVNSDKLYNIVIK